jgi:hypothetical protein
MSSTVSVEIFSEWDNGLIGLVAATVSVETLSLMQLHCLMRTHVQLLHLKQ